MKKIETGNGQDVSTTSKDFPLAGRSGPMQEVYRIIARVVSVQMNADRWGTRDRQGTGGAHHSSSLWWWGRQFCGCAPGGLTEDRFDQMLFGSDLSMGPMAYLTQRPAARCFSMKWVTCRIGRRHAC